LDDVIGRIDNVLHPTAGLAEPISDIARANRAMAILALVEVTLTRPSFTDRAWHCSGNGIRDAVDLADSAVLIASGSPRLVGQTLQMRSAVSGTIGIARAGVLAADAPSAGSAHPNLVACQDRFWLVGTRAAMAFTREASATVGSSQVFGTVDLGVHGTCRLMPSAHVTFARRTPHRLIKADRLIRAPFTQGCAGRAQPPFPERGVR
jgi:hypothetical protein